MARPIWKGSINFGLVNIPVQLETAVRERTVNFHLLSKDGSCRLRRKLYCPDTGKEMEYADTARGIEVGKDEYVLVDEHEIEKIKPEKGRSIEIEQFVQLDEIDPVYFDRAYYVTPTEGSSKAYKLLHEAMHGSGRIALARFVMRERQYLSALRISGDGIVLHTMHFADEVLPLEESLPGTLNRAKPATKELAIAQQLIEAMTHPLDLTAFKDDYRMRLEQLVEAKTRGKKTIEVADDHESNALPRSINLMDALRKSLQANKPPRAAATRHPRRKSA
jgi:DNA end-binding protein Ku